MVKLILVLDQSLDGKLFLHERLARLAKRLPQGFVLGQAHETVLQLGQVTRGDKRPGFSIEADFSGSIAVESHHRLAHCHRLRQGAGQTFPAGEMHEAIHGAHE